MQQSNLYRAYLWLASLGGTIAVITISFFWLDRPVALFAHEHFRYPHREIADELSRFPNPIVVLALGLSIILGAKMLVRWPLSRNQANMFVCSLSVLGTEAIKNCLKYIFGRTWPETWIQDNPSFIRDGVYGFNFMHGGVAYLSFPSGHMATACAVISVLWVRYPQFRFVYLAAGLLIAAVLVGTNYHFLSDVIGGTFLGISIGWMGTVIWDACVARSSISNFAAMTARKISL